MPGRTRIPEHLAVSRFNGQESHIRKTTDQRVQRWADELFRRLCQAGALLIIVLAIMLVAVLAKMASEAIVTLGIRFFTTSTWDPEPTHRQFGALAFVYGTMATSAIAMFIAVPLGVGTAAFLSEIAPNWLRRGGSFFVEMLAAVPSVVYGFWGVVVLAPILQEVYSAVGAPDNNGYGILSAGIILAIMIVPYVCAVSFDVCQAVPRSQREGSFALGATRWQTIWSVVLPYARPGIIGGCFLALGRALGETMAVTMLIGNVTQIRLSPFELGNSIPSVIANELAEAAYDLYSSALVELGLVLFLVTVVINALARLLIWRVSRPSTKKRVLLGGRLTTARVPVSSHDAPTSDSTSRLDDQRSSQRYIASNLMNQLMTIVLGLCFAVCVGFLFLILGFLVYEGFASLNWNFFINTPMPVGEEGGGMANAIYGSFMLVGLATLFAVPIGLLAAIYLAEYRSDRLGPAVRFIADLLGGVPSIVIGIFAYFLLVKGRHFSGWAGAFALGVMMLPIVMRASEEALRLVPKSIRHASFALGASHYQTVLRVTVPAALPAVITAIFLAIGRIVGETAPLLFTAFSNSGWPSSPNEPTPSLPYYIFTYATSPSEDWHRQGWAAALVLLIVVMILNFGVRLVAGRRAVLASRAD